MRSSMPRAGGFSIIELLISVAIGLLALTLATRLITSSESSKASSLGSSDSMQNGMLAMFSISADARQAGFGLNDPLLLGCQTRFVDNRGYALAGSPVNGAAGKPLAPAIIQDGGSGSDTITLYSGGSSGGTGTMRLVANYAAGARLDVDRVPYGFALGDVVVVAPEDRAGDCALAQVSAAPGTDRTLFVGAGDSAFRYNDGSLGRTFTGGKARVFHLGSAAGLSFHTWRVADGFLQLRSTDKAANGGDWVVVADNIVAIKAQYGFDRRSETDFAPQAGINVGTWSATMIDADGQGGVGSRGDYERMTALRIAVVARSKTRTGPPDGASCTATTANPRVFATDEPRGTDAVPVEVDLSAASADWRCYRYRVFETIVPIRNANWRP